LCEENIRFLIKLFQNYFVLHLFIFKGENIQNFESSKHNFDGTNISLCFIVSQLLKYVDYSNTLNY